MKKTLCTNCGRKHEPSTNCSPAKCKYCGRVMTGNDVLEIHEHNCRSGFGWYELNQLIAQETGIILSVGAGKNIIKAIRAYENKK